MKTFFIHGFGETEAIFEKIAPALPQPQVFVNVWDLLGVAPREGLNVLNFAQEVIDKHHITAQDVVIGHSMGGWIAHHIKHLVGCQIIQIGSWTHFDRLISPISSPKLVYWLVRNNLYINKLQLWAFGLSYKGKPSEAIFRDAFQRLLHSPKEAVISQLKLMFEPVPHINTPPDLRIHALKDTVIRYPKEPFHEVPGDHFTLITQPETVIEPILKMLGK